MSQIPAETTNPEAIRLNSEAAPAIDFSQIRRIEKSYGKYGKSYLTLILLDNTPVRIEAAYNRNAATIDPETVLAKAIARYQHFWNAVQAEIKVRKLLEFEIRGDDHKNVWHLLPEQAPKKLSESQENALKELARSEAKADYQGREWLGDWQGDIKRATLNKLVQFGLVEAAWQNENGSGTRVRLSQAGKALIAFRYPEYTKESLFETWKEQVIIRLNREAEIEDHKARIANDYCTALNDESAFIAIAKVNPDGNLRSAQFEIYVNNQRLAVVQWERLNSWGEEAKYGWAAALYGNKQYGVNTGENAIRVGSLSDSIVALNMAQALIVKLEAGS